MLNGFLFPWLKKDQYEFFRIRIKVTRKNHFIYTQGLLDMVMLLLGKLAQCPDLIHISVFIAQMFHGFAIKNTKEVNK